MRTKAQSDEINEWVMEGWSRDSETEMPNGDRIVEFSLEDWAHRRILFRPDGAMIEQPLHELEVVNA